MSNAKDRIFEVLCVTLHALLHVAPSVSQVLVLVVVHILQGIRRIHKILVRAFLLDGDAVGSAAR
jgi:hypothetical protein